MGALSVFDLEGKKTKEPHRAENNLEKNISKNWSPKIEF